jgi:hypothetical protein
LARAGTRRLIIVSGVLGIGLVSAGAALEFASHRSHTIPVIEADSRPIRVRPDNPGGMQIAGVGESILSGATSRTPETLAPPPEAPDPSGLRQQEQAARARDAAPKLPDSIQGLNKPGAIALDVPQPPSTDADAAAAAPSGPAPVIRPIPPPTQKFATAAQPPAPTAIAPAAIAPATIAPKPPAPAARAAAPIAKPAIPAPAQAASAPAMHPLATGEKQVQLAAVGSQAAATAEWARLSRLMPELLANRHPDVTEFNHDGRTYWRLRTGGFADAAAVTEFCSEIRAKGFNCFPASF